MIHPALLLGELGELCTPGLRPLAAGVPEYMQDGTARWGAARRH
jgi:hypothetical protein